MHLKTKMIEAVLTMSRFPVLPQKPRTGKWYRIPMLDCVTANGRAYHADLKIGTENKLVILFYGGGVSWNEYMAARPEHFGGNPDKIHFYCEDASRIADMVARIGLHTLSRKPSNFFHNWNMLAIPYSSGDFHCGTGDFSYTALDGSRKVLHHHGYTNYRSALTEAMKHIGSNPEQILVTGFSAGGFGTALLTDDVMHTFPHCSDVTCYVDSGFMLFPEWQKTAESVWMAPKEIAERIHSDNITLDCLQALKRDHGDRVKIAFSCSSRDAALSEYINYVRNGKLYADRESGLQFQKELGQMCRELQQTIPDSALFIFDTPDEHAEKKADGLTKHCIGPADKIVVEGISAAQWLQDTVCGKERKIGLKLLEQ